MLARLLLLVALVFPALALAGLPNHRFLTADGTLTGSHSILVDGSTTPVDLYAECEQEAGCEVYAIHWTRYKSSSSLLGKFGDGLAPLADGDGLILGIARAADSYATVEPVVSTHRPDNEIRFNKDVGYGPGVEVLDLIDNRQTVVFSAAHFGGPIALADGDRVVLRVRADLRFITGNTSLTPFVSVGMR